MMDNDIDDDGFPTSTRSECCQDSMEGDKIGLADLNLECFILGDSDDRINASSNECSVSTDSDHEFAHTRENSADFNDDDDWVTTDNDDDEDEEQMEEGKDALLLDWGPDARDRFNSFEDQIWGRDDNEPSYGPDCLILTFNINLTPGGYRWVWLPASISEVWQDREHLNGPPEGDYLLPWEDKCSGKGRPADDPLPYFPKRYRLESIYDPKTWKFRLLFLSPDHGDKKAPLYARLITSILFLHSCFTAVRNTRGNPSVKGEIVIDGQTWEITKNLETFLREMRLPTQCRVLWIRELCIDKCHEEERTNCYNWKYQKMVESCSCGILLMNEVMDALDERGLIEKPLRPQPKLWNEVTEYSASPIHFPVHLGRYLDSDEGRLPFQYLPLDFVADEIRILVLQTAPDYHSQLVGSLTHVPLHGSVKYFALSYTWGKEPADRTLVLNGQIMHITKNLDEAMRALRPRKVDNGLAPWFWIDALCIDQANSQEKSRQIPRMQDIYDCAIAVIAWPGPNTKIIQTGMSFARELTQPKITIFNHENGKPTTLKHTPRLAKAWGALYEVLRQPFFRRQWIVQELASANLPNVAPARGKVFHWAKFYSAARAFEENLVEILALWRAFSQSTSDAQDIDHAEDLHSSWNSLNPSPLDTHRELAQAEMEIYSKVYLYEQGLNDVWQTVRSIKILSFIRHLRMSEQIPSFLMLLILTQHFDCTDPRDKIYALWNLAKDSKCLPISPDYSKSTAKVYSEFVKAYAIHQQSLDIICATQFSFNAASTPLVPGPGPDKDMSSSWCPDWRQGLHMNTFVRNSIFSFDFDEIEEIPFLDYCDYHASRLEGSSESRLDNHSWTGCHGCSVDASATLTPFSFRGSDLIAAGCIVDTVAYVSEAPYDWWPMRTLTQEWKDILLDKYRLPDGSKPPVSVVEGAFFSMIVGQNAGVVTASLTDPVGYTLDVPEYLRPPHHSYDWKNLIRHNIKGRRLIITQKGYMGLAPWYVRTGFKLAILLSCSVPIVLEDYQPDEVVEEEPTGFYYRGDCFVQGWMYGEMMREFGSTNEEVCAELMSRERICIH